MLIKLPYPLKENEKILRQNEKIEQKNEHHKNAELFKKMLIKNREIFIKGKPIKKNKHSSNNFENFITSEKDYRLYKKVDNKFSKYLDKQNNIVWRKSFLIDQTFAKPDLFEEQRQRSTHEAKMHFLANQVSKHTVLLKNICFYKNFQSKSPPTYEISLELVLEDMQYGSLTNILKTSPNLSITTQLKIALDLAQGLNDLHRNHIIHRDISTHNVLVNHNMQTKITDFQYAMMCGESNALYNEFICTYNFIAPEVDENEDYTKFSYSSDIYALGKVLLALFSGCTYEAKTTEKMLDMLRPNLKPMITSCLNEQPTKRPTSADLVGILAPLLQNEQTEKKIETIFSELAIHYGIFATKQERTPDKGIVNHIKEYLKP